MEEMKAATTEKGLVITADEIGIAKANLKFALENCPVDGGILAEDGRSFSRESVEALLGRLEDESSPSVGQSLTEGELSVMRALAEYALEECPIEGGLVRDDGSLVSMPELQAYRERIGAALLVEAQ